ncbi:hypothetical protein B0H13DRAFT_1896029 [Mycena leptocephala]|nr:hypothetical protein B0H13DRAFT_1896029 [Mycena leptocephala]
MGCRSKNKENQDPGSDKKRCYWNAECDVVHTGQLAAEKSAGNQTDNAGWHQSAWTACSKALKGMEKKSGGGAKTADTCQMHWSSLKAQYQLVKMLRDKSGWGWNDQDKHIIVEDAVWEAYVAINPKVAGWCFKGFPLYDEMAHLLRSDTGIADAFLAIKDEDAEYCID